MILIQLWAILFPFWSNFNSSTCIRTWLKKCLKIKEIWKNMSTSLSYFADFFSFSFSSSFLMSLAAWLWRRKYVRENSRSSIWKHILVCFCPTVISFLPQPRPWRHPVGHLHCLSHHRTASAAVWESSQLGCMANQHCCWTPLHHLQSTWLKITNMQFDEKNKYHKSNHIPTALSGVELYIGIFMCKGEM